jgi:hypothetical protein
VPSAKPSTTRAGRIRCETNKPQFSVKMKNLPNHQCYGIFNSEQL